jgi:hypothetical protein
MEADWMALIRCPDCGREISDAAPGCIGCGRPMVRGVVPSPAIAGDGIAKKSKGGGVAKFFWVLLGLSLVALVVLLGFVAVNSGKTEYEKATAAYEKCRKEVNRVYGGTQYGLNTAGYRAREECESIRNSAR